MESTDLDMGEIFDDNDVDEDIGATGVLPDLEPTQTQNYDEDENAEVLARLKDLSKGAAKKVVRKPQPKLDPTRLTGERGIPILPKVFDDVKFKGKGHESHDLAMLMRQMEHWAHRLFPKMPFDEVIERVEKLGGKKEVQTCIKKIRLDMPVLSEDFVGSDKDDDDDDDVVRRGDDEPGISAQDEDQGEVRAEDMWDELLKEEAEISASQAETVPAFTAVKASSQPDSVAIDTPATPVQNERKPNSDGMTPEMLERMERNKQLALEKRLKKMGRLTPGSKLLGSPLSSQTPSKTNTTNNVTPKPVETKNTDIDNSENMTVHNETSKPLEDKQTDIENMTVDAEESVEKEDMVFQVTNRDINTADDDNEMSEVLEKGPSQNLKVAGAPKENAQNWHTGAASHSDTGLKLDSQTENMDTEDTDKVVDKFSNSKEMSEVIENQNGDCPQGLSQSSVESSQAMSEIIEPVENEKIVLKERANNTSVVKDNSEKINDTNDKVSAANDKVIASKDNSIATSDKTLATNDKIADKMNTFDKADKENTDTDNVDMKGDHSSSNKLEDHFDDELTEDQLMETLEY